MGRRADCQMGHREERDMFWLAAVAADIEEVVGRKELTAYRCMWRSEVADSVEEIVGGEEKAGSVQGCVGRRGLTGNRAVWGR